MKLFKNTKYILSAILVLIFEQVCGKYISICGSVPMLTFSFCVSAAMHIKDFDTAFWGAALLGALCDILSGHGFGTYTLTFAIACASANLLHNQLFTSKILFLICNVFIMTVFSQSFYFLVHINEIGNDFAGGFVSKILPMSVYNCVTAVFFYKITARLLQRR